MVSDNMLWRWWLRMMPNVAMAVLLIHQLVDIAEAGTGEMSLFFQQHPWYVFTAVVSIVLTSAHLFLFAIKTQLCCTWKMEPFNYKRIELLLYSIDGSWGFLWVLQVIVQALLPEDHRPFTLVEMGVILALYVVQTAVDGMCVYYLYDEFRHGLTLFGRYKAVSQTDPMEIASLRRPATQPIKTSGVYR